MTGMALQFPPFLVLSSEYPKQVFNRGKDGAGWFGLVISS